MKKSIIITAILTTLIALTFISTSFAARAPIIPAGSEANGNTLKIPHATEEGIPEENYIRNTFLPNITKNIIAIAGGAAFLFVIIGAIQILTAYGSDEKMANGKKTITFAIVGLVIAMLSYAIVSIISAIQLDNPAPTETSMLIQTAHAQSLIPEVTYPKESYDIKTDDEGKTTKIGKASKIGMVELLPSGDWKTILGNAIKIILGITGSLALISITVGGVMMIIAQGNEEEISKGRSILIWSIVALLFIAGSYAIILGVSQLQYFQ